MSSIKFSTEINQDSLRKGNFYIGTGDVPKGPTSVTGYYNLAPPPESGYRVYLYNDNARGDISYYEATNDEQLISYTNNMFDQSFTSVTQCLVYYSQQTDKICINRPIETIPTEDLGIKIDAGQTLSYPTSGASVYNLSGDYSAMTMNNGIVFGINGEFSFDGIDDYISIPSSVNEYIQSTGITITTWVKFGSFINSIVPNSFASKTYPIFQKPIGSTLHGSPSLRIDKFDDETLCNITFTYPSTQPQSTVFTRTTLSTDTWYFIGATIIPDEYSPDLNYNISITTTTPNPGEACFIWNRENQKYINWRVNTIKLNSVDKNNVNVLQYFQQAKTYMETSNVVVQYRQINSNGNYTYWDINSIDISGNTITLTPGSVSYNVEYQISPELTQTSVLRNKFGVTMFLNNSFLVNTSSNNPPIDYSAIVNGEWTIGKTNAPYYFRGSLSTLQVYKKSLTVDEMLEIFNNQKSRFGY